MPRSKIVVLGAVATVALVVAVTLGYPGPDERPVCGCDPAPPIGVHAKPTADRFESLVRAGEVDSAWAMLTDTARTRYGDVSGFRPVARRLAARYAAGAGSDWALLSPKAGGPELSGVVARLPASASQPDPAIVVQQVIMVAQEGSPGEWRADPEPANRDVRAHADGPKRIRLEHTDTHRHWLGVWILDATGQKLTRTWATTAPDNYTVHMPGSPITNPVLVFVAGSADGRTWWVGATTVTVEH